MYVCFYLEIDSLYILMIFSYLDEHQVNFPRNQLKYLREFGSTWYGQAVEGEAYNIVSHEDKIKVVVKILRVDATATEHMQFLQETRPFR